MKRLLLATALLVCAALPIQAQVAPSAAEAAAYRGLHAAAHKGDLAALRQLIGAKADLDARDPYGRTPLHVATFARQREAIQSRQVEVEQGGVEALHRDLGQGGQPMRGMGDRMPLFAQQALHHLGHDRVILDQQQPQSAAACGRQRRR